MVQAAVPVQPPPVHAVKAEVLAAFGVRVTFVPALKVAVHVVGQLIPAGLLLTVPEPATVTDRVGSTKLAVTARLEFTVNTHVPVPEHPAPLQPPKRKFVPGVAVSVT